MLSRKVLTAVLYKHLAVVTLPTGACHREQCLTGTSLVLVPDLIDWVLLHGHFPAHPRTLYFGGLTRLGLRHLRDVEPVEIGRGVL